MKKINTLSPKILIGMEFNIPLFQAKKQLYRCTDIADASSISMNSDEKCYMMELEEIPMGYSVPDKLRINIIISKSTGVVGITLFEVRPSPATASRLSFIKCVIDDFNTLTKLKDSFFKLGNRI